MRRFSLTEIERDICEIVSQVLGVRRAEIHPALRLIQDLHIDSIDVMDLFFRMETKFDVDLPHDSQDVLYKTVFTRNELRISDLAELVYLQQGRGGPVRKNSWSKNSAMPVKHIARFSQLGGKYSLDRQNIGPLFEPLGENRAGYSSFHRRTDGMICVQIPTADVVIGSGKSNAMPDERPARRVHIDSFLIDQEPVSTTAYCRFLNSGGTAELALLEKWFVLAPNDKRQQHELLRHGPDGWNPLPGTERMPMMLVSWFGADAYSRWANGQDWQKELEGGNFLPSEAQWEYAARGIEPRMYPWGDDEPTPDKARYGQFTQGQRYHPDQLPMADVNAELGMSPFGLHHMAGNVWQWCRDWYAPQIRSERGGSWVGPAFLCRSSYRRGRVPTAKGRCLGFRCISLANTGH